MELTTICKLFAAFTGMTAEETLEQLDLIRLAKEELEASLKPGCDPEEHRQALSYAAAALAFYRYSLLAANTGGVRSLRSGEMTVTSDSDDAVRVAREIRDEFLALAAPCLRDDRFLFRAV